MSKNEFINRSARYDYFIKNELECGIVLTGSEVKSLMLGGGNISDSYAEVVDGELWLINSYIAPYEQAKTWGHEAKCKRKLLAKKKEIAKLWSEVSRKGLTLVPLKLYRGDSGKFKVLLAIGQGKKKHDKRASDAERDFNRRKQTILKNGKFE